MRASSTPPVAGGAEWGGTRRRVGEGSFFDERPGPRLKQHPVEPVDDHGVAAFQHPGPALASAPHSQRGLWQGCAQQGICGPPQNRSVALKPAVSGSPQPSSKCAADGRPTTTSTDSGIGALRTGQLAHIKTGRVPGPNKSRGGRGRATFNHAPARRVRLRR